MAATTGTQGPRQGARERPLSVSQVVRGANRVLERKAGTFWVEGETTSVKCPGSGHVYFTLRDASAQLPAVIWRSDAQRLGFRMEDGLRLRCHGHLGIFERDGKFQIYVRVAEPAGLGAEALALEQLKLKLAGEGLFDPARKRPLPLIPRRIGVVTSASGAAVRDIIRAVQRRFPVPILVADAAVQGADAPRSIVAALVAIATTDVDLVIVGRGGGSRSDLSAFNDEAVVRQVAACPVPVISAVGHEIDTSLADLAADRRAATPTMAGEMAVPVHADLAAGLEKIEQRLLREIGLCLRDARGELDQQLDGAEARLRHRLVSRRGALSELSRRLEVRHPRARMEAHRAAIGELEARLRAAARLAVDRRKQGLAGLAGRLDAMSPLRVLDRGYALATRDGAVLTDASAAAPGDSVEVRLARGRLACRVEGSHRE